MAKDKTAEMAESFPLLMLVTMSGGLMDAYSYLGRGHVFANAQTGNLLLLGVNVANGDFAAALTYLCPVLAFCAGIALAELARRHFRVGRMHWQQATLLFAALTLFFVGLISEDGNLAANSLTSLACGVQLQSFRRVYGHGVATTMCIGNLRVVTQSLCDYFHDGDRDALKKGGLFLLIILLFIFGAVLGDLALRYFALKTIWCSSALLLLSFVILFFGKREGK